MYFWTSKWCPKVQNFLTDVKCDHYVANRPWMQHQKCCLSFFFFNLPSIFDICSIVQTLATLCGSFYWVFAHSFQCVSKTCRHPDCIVSRHSVWNTQSRTQERHSEMLILLVSVAFMTKTECGFLDFVASFISFKSSSRFVPTQVIPSVVRRMFLFQQKCLKPSKSSSCVLIRLATAVFHYTIKKQSIYIFTK